MKSFPASHPTISLLSRFLLLKSDSPHGCRSFHFLLYPFVFFLLPVSVIFFRVQPTASSLVPCMPPPPPCLVSFWPTPRPPPAFPFLMQPQPGPDPFCPNFCLVLPSLRFFPCKDGNAFGGVPPFPLSSERLPRMFCQPFFFSFFPLFSGSAVTVLGGAPPVVFLLLSFAICGLVGGICVVLCFVVFFRGRGRLLVGRNLLRFGCFPFPSSVALCSSLAFLSALGMLLFPGP